MSKPNILVFMTDHQRADSVYPYTKAITPNAKALALEGVTFKECYTTAPHCCPARASFYSGLFPSQHGVWNNVNVENALTKGLYEDVRLFTEDLADDGYDMRFAGKWHVSALESPLHRGFNYMEVPKPYPESKEPYRHIKPDTSQTWEKFYKNFVQEDLSNRKEGEIIRKFFPKTQWYKEDDFTHANMHDEKTTNNVIDALKSRQNNKPWFQFVGINGPHDPYHAKKKYLDMYDINDIELPKNFEDMLGDKPALYRHTREHFSQLTPYEQRQTIRHYLAYCSFVDDLFGQIISTLKETDQYDNTVIFYLSDHGDYMGEHGLWAKGLPCFKGAYNIPCIIKPIKEFQQTTNTVIDDYICITDMAPTMLELANIKVEREFDGNSLVPYLEGMSPLKKREAIYTQSNGNEAYGIQRSVWTKDYKLVFNSYDYDELYDLKNDPDEINNLYNQAGYEKTIKKLYKMLWKFAYEHDDACVNPYIMTSFSEYGPAIIFEEET